MPEGSSTMTGEIARASAAERVPGVPSTAPRTAPRTTSFRAAWQHALFAFALCFVALLAIYADTVLDLWDEWGKTGTYAHGYFIFPISAWLVWRSRARLARIAPTVQPWALVPLVACAPLWLAGHSAGVHAVTQYAFVAMVPCLVWGIFGNAVTARILYPLAFLFFAVPTGEFLMPTLMDHTADFTVTALRFSGVPVFREGNYFSIPSGNWSVVEACSGIRYLIASITLGFLFAYLNYRATWRRVAFIGAAIVVPVIANWLRAYMIVMIAHLSSNKLATGVDHLVYGWLFFGLVMLLLFWFGNLWRDDDDGDHDADHDGDEASAASRSTVLGPGSAKHAVVAMTAAMLVVLAPWPAIDGRIEAIANDVHPGDLSFATIPGWRTAEPFTAFTPVYAESRALQTATFASGENKVELFVAYYSGQLAHGRMITYSNDVVLPATKGWNAVSRRSRAATANGASFDVDETTIRGQDSTERLLTWRWYWVNGRLTNNKYFAKAYNALDKITGRGDDSAVIFVMTSMSSASDAEAATRLDAFVAAAGPVIGARLAIVHDEARR